LIGPPFEEDLSATVISLETWPRVTIFFFLISIILSGFEGQRKRMIVKADEDDVISKPTFPWISNKIE